MPLRQLQTSFKDPSKELFRNKGEIPSCKSVKPFKNRKKLTGSEVNSLSEQENVLSGSVCEVLLQWQAVTTCTCFV